MGHDRGCLQKLLTVVVDEMVEQSAPDLPGAQLVMTVAEVLKSVEVERRVVVSRTVVVRVIVLRVVNLPSSPLAGTRPVDECPACVDPVSAGGGADPCSPATLELSVPGIPWF